MDDIGTCIMSGDLSTLGQILEVNHKFCSIFNFSKNELIKNSISIIIPYPISSNHNSFIMRYLESAKKNILDKLRVLMSVNSFGFLLPVMLFVKLIPNLKQSVRFIGLIKKIPRSYKLFRTLDSIYEDEICFIMTNKDGFVTALSKSALTHFGVPLSVTYSNKFISSLRNNKVVNFENEKLLNIASIIKDFNFENIKLINQMKSFTGMNMIISSKFLKNAFDDFVETIQDGNNPVYNNIFNNNSKTFEKDKIFSDNHLANIQLIEVNYSSCNELAPNEIIYIFKILKEKEDEYKGKGKFFKKIMNKRKERTMLRIQKELSSGEAINNSELEIIKKSKEVKKIEEIEKEKNKNTNNNKWTRKSFSPIINEEDEAVPSNKNLNSKTINVSVKDEEDSSNINKSNFENLESKFNSNTIFEIDEKEMDEKSKSGFTISKIKSSKKLNDNEKKERKHEKNKNNSISNSNKEKLINNKVSLKPKDDIALQIFSNKINKSLHDAYNEKNNLLKLRVDIIAKNFIIYSTIFVVFIFLIQLIDFLISVNENSSIRNQYNFWYNSSIKNLYLSSLFLNIQNLFILENRDNFNELYNNIKVELNLNSKQTEEIDINNDLNRYFTDEEIFEKVILTKLKIYKDLEIIRTLDIKLLLFREKLNHELIQILNEQNLINFRMNENYNFEYSNDSIRYLLDFFRIEADFFSLREEQAEKNSEEYLKYYNQIIKKIYEDYYQSKICKNVDEKIRFLQIIKNHSFSYRTKTYSTVTKDIDLDLRKNKLTFGLLENDYIVNEEVICKNINNDIYSLRLENLKDVYFSSIKNTEIYDNLTQTKKMSFINSFNINEESTEKVQNFISFIYDFCFSLIVRLQKVNDLSESIMSSGTKYSLWTSFLSPIFYIICVATFIVLVSTLIQINYHKLKVMKVIFLLNKKNGDKIIKICNLYLTSIKKVMLFKNTENLENNDKLLVIPQTIPATTRNKQVNFGLSSTNIKESLNKASPKTSNTQIPISPLNSSITPLDFQILADELASYNLVYEDNFDDQGFSKILEDDKIEEINNNYLQMYNNSKKNTNIVSQKQINKNSEYIQIRSSHKVNATSEYYDDYDSENSGVKKKINLEKQIELQDKKEGEEEDYVPAFVIKKRLQDYEEKLEMVLEQELENTKSEIKSLLWLDYFKLFIITSFVILCYTIKFTIKIQNDKSLSKGDKYKNIISQRGINFNNALIYYGKILLDLNYYNSTDAYDVIINKKLIKEDMDAVDYNSIFNSYNGNELI